MNNTSINSFAKRNPFYVITLIVIIVAILLSNFVMIYGFGVPNYQLIGRTWVIGSSLLSGIYTLWFWFRKNGKGKGILHNITTKNKNTSGNKKEGVDNEIKDNKVDCSLTIGMSGVLLIVIALINLIGGIWGFDDKYEVKELGSWGPLLLSHIDVFSTLFLMIITYYIFCRIDKTIIKSYAQMKGKKAAVVKRDFEYAFINIDRPSFIAFVSLAIYFIAIVYTTHNTMYLFFYGAIAFQMLFSSIIWANSEITDD